MSIDEEVRSRAVGPGQVVVPSFRQPAPAPAPVRRRLNTPQWIQVLTAGSLVAIIAVMIVCQVAVSSVRSGWDRIGHQMAPQVVSTTGVTFALNDMDAQLANLLLVANRTDLGVTRQQSLELYESDRRTVSTNLQQAAVLAGTDPAAVQRIRTILDQLGQYEAYAAQVMLLERQASPAVPGRPPVGALSLFRQATDLMHKDLLPAVATLTETNSAALNRTYTDRQASIADARWILLLVGIVLIAVLVWLQLFLARRTHRVVNPRLLFATVVSVAVVIGGSVLLSGEAKHLKVAKHDAFNSILVLTKARATSYDANADESRYLLDPDRAATYEQTFNEKSSQVKGFLDVELHNITFAGERAAADAAVTSFGVYLDDDRHIRELNRSGDLSGAIAFCTSYAPGASNAAFTEYDKALVQVTNINQHAFDGAVSDGERGLRGWGLIPWIAGGLAVLLVLAGVRARLAEYR
ncbi:hypothetical protein ACFWUU_32325 [Kribbella sp. NPDC058693]|uniref:hypothetical protein n=1 Tax=Kribbella sp. NPDC058693 TaxID=3346602 RepID=UPI0036593D7F